MILYYLVYSKYRLYIALIFISFAVLYAHALGKSRIVLEAGFIFDLYIGLFFVFGAGQVFVLGIVRNLALLLIAWLVVFFLYTYYLYSLPQHFVLYEYLRSFRVFFYLISFILAVNYVICTRHKPVDVNEAGFVKFIVLLFLAVYLVKALVLGVARPWLFSENNFEMAMVMILIAITVYYNESRSNHVFYLISGAGVAIISFSKSAILEAAALIGRQLKFKTMSSVIFAVIGGFAVIATVLYVFSQRLGDDSIEEVDRFLFLTVFWQEYSMDGLFSMLFGYAPASNLTNTSCMILGFWVDSMFSSLNYCNSVIFHSFIMRLVYDFGLITSIAFVSAWWYLLGLIYGMRLSITLMAILLLSALSVSSFSNGIILFPVFLLISKFHLRDD